MLSYSDYILALKPWSYCRLNEPVGYTVYSDISGNDNHFMMNTQAVGTISNCLENFFQGDPSIKAVRLTGITSISEGYIDWNIFPDSLVCSVSRLKSQVPHRSYGKLEYNDLSINSLWCDVLVSSDFYAHIEPSDEPKLICSYFQPLIALGPLRVFLKTIVRFDENNDYIGHNLYFCVSVEEWQHNTEQNSEAVFSAKAGEKSIFDLQYNDVFISFSGEFAETDISGWFHRERLIYSRLVQSSLGFDVDPFPIGEMFRLTFGVAKQDKSYILNVFINGESVVSESLVKLVGDNFIDIDSYSCYSKIALMNGFKYSNISVFFNKPFPDVSWLEESQIALERNYQPNDLNDIQSEFQIIRGDKILSSQQGSVYAFFDSILLYGTEQIQVYKIQSVGNLVTISVGQHKFVVGDIIEIGGSQQNSLNGLWRLSSIGFDTISFISDTSVNSEMVVVDVVIVKKAPIGGGRWYKSIDDYVADYISLDFPVNLPKTLKLDDFYQYSCHGWIEDKNNNLVKSDVLFLNRPQREKKKWLIIGDNKRFYIFIGKHDDAILSNASLIFFGVLRRNVISPTETINLIMNTTSLDENREEHTGFNFVFLYPNWRILDSGHLLCSVNNSSRNSKTLMIKSDLTYEYIFGLHDSGSHIYPEIE